jgi:hypothetical protein
VTSTAAIMRNGIATTGGSMNGNISKSRFVARFVPLRVTYVNAHMSTSLLFCDKRTLVSKSSLIGSIQITILMIAD